MAAQGPSGRGVLHAPFAGRVGGMQSTLRDELRGCPLEDCRNPARQHLAFFHASTCQGARWRIKPWLETSCRVIEKDWRRVSSLWKRTPRHRR